VKPPNDLWLLALTVAVLATATVWVCVMPDAPQDALEDGIFASLSASLTLFVVSRRTAWLK
jgi:hypothetical protein